MRYTLILYETAFRPRARGSDHRFASRHMASPAASPAAAAAAPQTWASAAVAFGTTQRILKVRPYWLDKILMGAKHLEIRGSPCPHVGWVSLATTGSQQVMCRVRFGPSRALTAVEEDDNREALAATGYARPWAWPIEEMQLLPQPVQVPPAVARGCVQWITRARWEAFDSEAASRAPNAGARWLTPPSLDAAESRPGRGAVEARSGEGAVRRRLRGKQPDALGAYPAQPGLRRKRSPSRKALVGKRPAGCRKNTHFCTGFGTVACPFNTKRASERAHASRGSTHCALCSQARLSAALERRGGRAAMVRVLKALRAHAEARPEIWTLALARVSLWAPHAREELEAAAAKPKRSRPEPAQPGARKRGRAGSTDCWGACAAKRQAAVAAPSSAAKKAYRATVLADQRRGKKRFFPSAPRREKAPPAELDAVVDNQDDLPPAHISTSAAALENWCRQGSWGMCPTCAILQPRPLRPDDLTKTALPEVAPSACRRCRVSQPHLVPQRQDAPPPLQNLTVSIVAALRPLDVDVGPEVRAEAGYRKKVRTITFSWALQSVPDKVRALPRAERRAAKAALHYLLEAEENEYKDYYRRQRDFLRRHTAPTAVEAKRPLHFIEEVGLENALWPHLYWKTTMCESYERLTHKRLQHWLGDAAPRQQCGSSDEDPDAHGDDPGEGGLLPAERRHSVKRSFQTKLLGPWLGYGADFELLQYVYDLHLWTDLGSKKGRAAGDISMRIMMSGHPMSPLYWADIKHGLFDLVRQIGYPDVYWTLAPYEFSYPYNQYLLDEMQKLLRGRLHLPAFEAMHLARTMTQICRGYIAGHSNTTKGKGWTQHLLRCKTEPGDRSMGCINFFTRIEFQDGSKKPGTQRYHGSGRPHVHALFWVRDLAQLDFAGVAAATLDLSGDQEALIPYVRGSQLDQHGESRWPVHEGPSDLDAASGALRLRHTKDDAAEGVRGYFPDVMSALKCHQDLQVSQGRGLLLTYVAKYVAKWSDSSYDEWMSDATSATSLCRKVLFEYHPLEPEMVLQLTGATFRQWEFGSAMGGRRSVRAPRPSNPEQPTWVRAYMDSGWRREDMSLLEFLRKTGGEDGGAIAGWLRQKHRAHVSAAAAAGAPADSLEDFANKYPMRGEQLVAVEFLYRLNDMYYGQWCVMHLPFRSMAFFDAPAVRDRVPERYRWFATALLLTDDCRLVPAQLHRFWRDFERAEAEMHMEGDSDSFVQDVKEFLAGQTLAIDRYLSGQLDCQQEPAGAAPRGPAPAPAAMCFEGKQAMLHKAVGRRVALAVAARSANTEQEEERLREEARGSAHRPVVCSGRPGTGKTTVVHRNVREALAAGGAVCVALPTARLATRMADKLGAHAGLLVDTFAAAFQLHKPEQEALYATHGYDLVVVDEFSQLSAADLERLLRIWRAADCLPALVFLGDKYQLPGVDPIRPWESAAWSVKNLSFVELHQIFRCDDPTFLETLQLLRTAMPTKLQLNNICRGRKAWQGDAPDVADIGRLLAQHPDATFVAATKTGVATINALAVEALHPRAQPLATIPGAFEDNPTNYVSGKLRDDRAPVPADVPVHRGLQLYLTRNVRKADDYINGMRCHVLSFDEARQILWVRTETGKRLPVTRWHDPDHARLVYFPVRLGYCTTVHKVQGDEFDFIIVYLDTANMPAVGYTALSRVRNSASYLLGGRLTPQHFTPVTMR